MHTYSQKKYISRQTTIQFTIFNLWWDKQEEEGGGGGGGEVT